MDSKPQTFCFSKALELLKSGQTVSRIQFRDTCTVKAQLPDENSKMTQPYLYMEKKLSSGYIDPETGVEETKMIRFPFDPSCESLFADDWYVVNN